jgi:uncharacterized protein YbjT (DUF2867 family)
MAASSSIVAVAGATGNLGFKIVRALVAKGATVVALTRSIQGVNEALRNEVTALGSVRLVEASLDDPVALQNALRGSNTVVSALQGDRSVMVDSQKQLIDAARSVGVSRFIPSDFSIDLFRIEVLSM